MQSIINKASSGIFWDDELQAEYESKYLPQKDLAIKEALESLMVTSIHEYRVAVIEAPKMLSKGILLELVYNLYDDVDIVILFSPDGKISIRRKLDSEIRCDLIAQKLNGGGHSYAAAGIIKSPIYLENSKTRTINVQDVIKALQVALA